VQIVAEEKKTSFASVAGAQPTSLLGFAGVSGRTTGVFPSAFTTAIKLGPVARPVGAIKYITLADFGRQFACRINTLPQNVCVFGWLQAEQRWYCAPHTFQGIRATHASHLFHNRSNEKLLTVIVRDVIEPLRLESLWFPYCFYDGWRERNVFSAAYRYVDPPDLSAAMEWQGAPGEIPILSPDRCWLGCFGAHRGDPSALLLPDLHYLNDRYASLFAEVDTARLPWRNRRDRAVFAAGDHGEPRNLVVPPMDATLHPRRLFQRTVERGQLHVDVFLGQRCSRAEQMQYRYIADVDGFARTWDAWAWKMMSGSTVLAVDSIWESFFSQSFQPWEHYVPVTNDCADLPGQLQWCRDHPTECEAIAARAHARAEIVYSAADVGQRLRTSFAQRLQLAQPAT